MGEIFFRGLVCAIAAVLIWFGAEYAFPDVYEPFSTEWRTVERWFLIGMGAAIGVAAGLLSGYVKGLRKRIWLPATVGLIGGAVGISLGSTIGGPLYTAMPVPPVRALAITLMGLGAGAGVGLAGQSWRTFMAGLVGGGIAGLIAGVLFDPLSLLFSQVQIAVQPGLEEGTAVEVGGPGRAALAASLGLGIGLFTAIVDRVTRSAWVRLNLGKNEGREWPVESGQTTIGRDERAAIPLFGDATVAELHAIIERRGKNYWLTDNHTGALFVNGQPVQQLSLTPGDHIQIGKFSLSFMTKNVRAPKRVEGQYVQQPPNGQPMPGQPMPGQPTQAMPGQPMPGQPTQAMSGQPMPGQPTQAMPSQPVQGQPTQALAGGWTLSAIGGPLNGQTFALAQPLEVGREASGIVVPDTAASRRHASFEPTPAGVQVTDLGSTNGTLINGVRQSQGIARPGDQVQIGSTVFRIDPA